MPEAGLFVWGLESVPVVEGLITSPSGNERLPLNPPIPRIEDAKGQRQFHQHQKSICFFRPKTTMNPVPLLNRKQVMAILNIHSDLTFNCLLKKQWVPPAVGRFKWTHLWQSSSIYELAERHIKLGISFSKDMTEDIVLQCLISSFELKHINR